MNTIKTIEQMLAEMGRANEMGLREFGVGLIDSKAIQAGRALLEQLRSSEELKQSRSDVGQEPVAYMYPDDLKEFETREMSAHAYSLEMVSPTQGETVPLYTTPQKPSTIVRTWVGLTDEEWTDAHKNSVSLAGFRKSIEALLKEKNT